MSAAHPSASPPLPLRFCLPAPLVQSSFTYVSHSMLRPHLRLPSSSTFLRRSWHRLLWPSSSPPFSPSPGLALPCPNGPSDPTQDASRPPFPVHPPFPALPQVLPRPTSTATRSSSTRGVGRGLRVRVNPSSQRSSPTSSGWGCGAWGWGATTWASAAGGCLNWVPLEPPSSSGGERSSSMLVLYRSS